MTRWTLCLLAGLLSGFVCGEIHDGAPSLLDHGWVPVHERMIAVRYVNLVLDDAAAEWPGAAFRIHSGDDPAYAEPRAPLSASYWVRPERYTIRKALNIKHTWIFLELPEPLRPGAAYTIEETGLSWRRLDPRDGKPLDGEREAAPAVTGMWRGCAGHRSKAVSVNQVGYLPEARKFGYLTLFAGHPDATREPVRDVDFSMVETFHLVDAVSGERQWSGPVTPPRGEGPDRLTQSRVWELEFSEFRRPGRYRLHVPGVGVSFPFQIGPEVYNHAFGVLMRGAYHQRCGTALEEPWTRFTHPACHLDDARVPALEEYKKDLKFLPQREGGELACAHGHHDAGDFGKYTINGALFAYTILQVFEVYPERMGFDQSPVPEAGNGIPDLLEEVKWELNWLSGMQDPDDGGVHIIVKPDPTMSYEDGVSGLPTPRFDKQRVVWWKDIHTTAAFAAVMARAARTPAFREHWPEEADRYLEQARAAWDFCMRHTHPDGSPLPMVGGHHYGAFLGARDEYAWMAAELWMTTGEDVFHEYFLTHHKPEESWNWNWWPLKEAAGAATRTYVFGPRDGKDPEMLARCRDGERGLIQAARTVRDWQREWATRPSFAPPAYQFGRWGWYFLSDIASYDLLLAASLVEGEERESFVQAALFNADQEFGNSADHRSSITGIGSRRPVDIVHQNARFDGIVEPIPGIPLGFHPAGFNRGSTDRALMASHMVGDLPIALRYVDCWNVEQEFTVDILAKTLMTYAMLGRADLQRGGFPSLTLTANGVAGSIQGEAPLTLRLEAEAGGANGKAVRELYWDLANEETLAASAFDYTFRVPGRYVVVCTATDEAGWATSASLEILVRQPEAELPNRGAPWTRDEETFAHWTFDDGLADAVGALEAELTGAARLSGDNLLWMRTPAGRALRVGDAEDGLRLPLPPRALTDDSIRRLQVDAMILYEEEVPRGRGHSRMALFHGHWDAQLGIHSDSWAGKRLLGLPPDWTEAEATNQKMRRIFSPRPGWRHLSLGFDRDQGTAFIAVDGDRIEWPFSPPQSQREISLFLGGFQGYLDEIRIQVKR